MTDEKAITVVNSGPNAISAWADRGQVREIAQRLQAFAQGSQKLDESQALALAQIAIGHGLDPFNGEVWYIPGSGVTAGIKGHRRAAHIQLDREANGKGANYWPEFELISQDEKALLNIPQKALAYRCKLRDTLTITAYTSQIEGLAKSGLPWEVIKEIVGERPFTEGIGYAMPTVPDTSCEDCHGKGWMKSSSGKPYHCKCSEPSKMTAPQLAQKRAEADALKRRFDLPFGLGYDSGDDDGQTFTVSTPVTPEQRKNGSAALYGDNPGTLEGEFRQVDDMTLEQALATKTAKGTALADLTEEQLVTISKVTRLAQPVSIVLKDYRDTEVQVIGVCDKLSSYGGAPNYPGNMTYTNLRELLKDLSTQLGEKMGVITQEPDGESA